MSSRAVRILVARATRALAPMAVSASLLASCGGKSDAPSPGSSSSPAPVPALPPLSVKDDTPGALFTWVDEKGDFHVVEHAADVPEASRGTVRVAVAGKGEGTAEAVYVADLRSKSPAGEYAVTTMARSAWEELGAARRTARMEALAPSAAPPAPPVPSGAVSPTGEISAVIYGASWCGPCHQAEALLKSLGVKVTKKDIETSDAASAEMQALLRKAHRPGGSIPVIELAGQIFVGFSDGALRAAVQRLRGGTAL